MGTKRSKQTMTATVLTQLTTVATSWYIVFVLLELALPGFVDPIMPLDTMLYIVIAIWLLFLARKHLAAH